VTQGEYRDFIEDGGYRCPELWLSDGWALVEAEGWTRPLYWHDEAVFGLGGLRPLEMDAPLTNISYYEAEAYARWAGARLPTEAEWEVAASLLPLVQIADAAWQWTGSAYLPYPGFRPAKGAVGEYNGKFMINQMVLRGGASITPPGHARLTYRNFFPPAARWAFSGIRLANSA
jgi:ergothioneine biosynthesis protein EgtB